MIASLTGKVQFLYSDRVVLDLAGVGYEVFLNSDAVSRLPEKGSSVFLHIHTHVREDALILYGFLEEEEKELFLALKTVSGIGPKLALAVLAGLRVGELCQAIAAADVKRLTTIAGVGKRTAERICVELKDKVGHLHTAAVLPGLAPLLPSVSSTVADALSALTNLGYPDPVARTALSQVKRRLGEESFAGLQLEEMIREGLKALV